MDFNLRRLGLNHSSKILSITHAFCMDGSVSQLILETVFKNITSIACKYEDIDNVLEESFHDGYDFIFLTDISPKNIDLLKGKNKVILLDHHNTAIAHHNPSENKYVIPEKFSGSSLTKRFCEEFFQTKLTHLDDLVYLSQDYDLWNKKNHKSTFLNELHFFYFGEKFKERFFDGDTRLNEVELGYLRKRKNEFKNTFNSLDIYELHKIDGAYVEAGNFLNEIAEKLLADKYKVVFVRNQSKYKNSISVRCRKGFVNVGEILKELGYGGGHSEAGGFVESDFMEMKSKIENIEKRILLELKRKK